MTIIRWRTNATAKIIFFYKTAKKNLNNVTCLAVFVQLCCQNILFEKLCKTALNSFLSSIKVEGEKWNKNVIAKL